MGVSSYLSDSNIGRKSVPPGKNWALEGSPFVQKKTRLSGFSVSGCKLAASRLTTAKPPKQVQTRLKPDWLG